MGCGKTRVSQRFDYTEEAYWRRLRADGPRVWTRHVPFHIEQLADGYGLEVRT